MSSGVGVGAAQAAAVRDILGPASQDGRISKEHKKLIHEVRDFIRNNAAPERSSDYKAWEDLDILEVLQERAEPRMNAIAAALHILESGEKPEPWHQATSHRDHHSNSSAPSKRGGRGASRGGRRQENGSDQRRISSPSNSQQRREGRTGSPSSTGRGGRGGARGGRAQSTSTHNNAMSGAARATPTAQAASEVQPATTAAAAAAPAASQPPVAAVAPPPAAAATKKPMNFAAAARSGTAAATPISTPAPAAAPSPAPSSSAPKTKPAKRVAKKAATVDHDETEPAPVVSAAPQAAVAAPTASGWKPKRNAETNAPDSVAPAVAAVAELSLEDKSQQAKVRLPASLSAGSSTGIKFGGPRASSNPASTSANSAPAPVAAEPASAPVAPPTAAPVTPAEMPSLPMQLPPGMPPNFYYFYNFMQPGLQGPQAPAMMQPDYGLASAALYGAGHQQPMPMDQASGQPAFSVNGLGMGSYPSQAPYGAYGGMPPTNMPSQYPQMGMLPPMGMGLPMNMLAAQTHPAAMQYQSMGQPSPMPPGYLQGAMQHAPAPGNQGSDSMHHGGHQDALHHGNGMTASQLPFGGAQVSSPQDQHHMMMHPYAQMMPYPVPAHMQHGSVDLFPAGATSNGASIFDQQQQQQRQSKPTQQVTQQPPAQQTQVGSQAGGVPSYSRSYVGAAQQTAQKQGPGAANNYPWGLQTGPTKSNQ